jgi:hypothetical protein
MGRRRIGTMKMLLIFSSRKKKQNPLSLTLFGSVPLSRTVRCRRCNEARTRRPLPCRSRPPGPARSPTGLPRKDSAIASSSEAPSVAGTRRRQRTLLHAAPPVGESGGTPGWTRAPRALIPSGRNSGPVRLFYCLARFPSSLQDRGSSREHVGLVARGCRRLRHPFQQSIHPAAFAEKVPSPTALCGHRATDDRASDRSRSPDTDSKMDTTPRPDEVPASRQDPGQPVRPSSSCDGGRRGQ